MARNGVETVPIGPFMVWLNNEVARTSLARVCKRVGWMGDSGQRRMYRYRRGMMESRRNGRRVVAQTAGFERAVVEDALHRAGVLFEEVYPPERFPALFDDIPLEPEAFCANCQDTCTPIRGECPFCDCKLLVRAA